MRAECRPHGTVIREVLHGLVNGVRRRRQGWTEPHPARHGSRTNGGVTRGALPTDDEAPVCPC